MLKIENVLDILAPHNETIGAEAAMALKLALMEADVDMPDLEALNGELEAERAGRAEDKAAYEAKIKEFDERITKFIRGEDPDPGVAAEVVEEVAEEVAEEVTEDFFERMYGGE